MHSDSFPAILTYWCMNPDTSPSDLAGTLSKVPPADPGFGRKYLAQLNPTWPIRSIGTFPLNRSAPVSRGEYYIAGHPGVTVVQAWREDVVKLSEVEPLPSPYKEVIITAVGDGNGFGGYAHWINGKLTRAFSATRRQLIEDLGVPQPFEAPFWAGEKATALGGIALPFIPSELGTGAAEARLGIPLNEAGPDVRVAAFAVDGRPDAKLRATATPAPQLPEAADYDDYERSSSRSDEELFRITDATASALRRLGLSAKHTAGSLAAGVKERLRHSDRPPRSAPAKETPSESGGDLDDPLLPYD